MRESVPLVFGLTKALYSSRRFQQTCLVSLPVGDPFEIMICVCFDPTNAEGDQHSHSRSREIHCKHNKPLWPNSKSRKERPTNSVAQGLVQTYLRHISSNRCLGQCLLLLRIQYGSLCSPPNVLLYALLCFGNAHFGHSHSLIELIAYLIVLIAFEHKGRGEVIEEYSAYSFLF